MRLLTQQRQTKSDMAEQTERRDSLPGCNYAIWQDAQEFCFTTDAVFLAAFAKLVRNARVLELGCGTGAISMLLAARGAGSVVGVDTNRHVLELLRRSIAENQLADRVSCIEADVRLIKQHCSSEAFDLVVANPPYRNSGKVRQVAAAACHEVNADLEEFFAAAAFCVKYRGRFAVVQLPERFAECMELAAKYKLQPKRLQWVHADINKPAWIFLLEMVKGGSYGLEVLPPLIMYDADGRHSQQTLKYYGM